MAIRQPPPPSNPGESNISLPNASGAGTGAGHLTISIRGAKRAMKAYTVTETEFIGLPMWKTILKFSDHVAFSAVSFAVGLSVQALFTDKISDAARAVLWVGLLFSGLITVCALVLRRHIAKSSQDIESVIKAETVHDEDNPQGSNNQRQA